jgi:hypothetical protein
MAHVQLIFEKAQFFQHRIGSTSDHVVVRLQFLNVLLAQGFAFAAAASRRDLSGDTAVVTWQRTVLA